MAGRIITLQRQARELGRLRTGTHNGKYPQRSETWVITSHSRDYIQAAAEAWGGDVEEWQPQGNGAKQWRVITEARAVDAILPPGDPLSQAYEQWTKGGCARRCDGETELLSDQACVCRAQWGPDFHQVAPAKDACSMTTRLNVIMPELPDLGVYRVETHSYYSANEIAAAVDVLKGQLGEQAMIPVRLRIEPRSRVAQGKTKQFPVIVLELRGVTAGQVLSGSAPATVSGGQPAPAVASGRPAPAIEAGAPASGRDWHADLDAARSADEVRELYRAAVAAGEMTQDLATVMREQVDALGQFATSGSYTPSGDRGPELGEQPEQAPASSTRVPPEDDEHPDPVAGAPADEGGDVDGLWTQIVTAWTGTTTELTEAFAARNGGELPESASADQLQAFLAEIRGGWVTAGQQADESPAPGSGERVPF